MFRFFNFQLVKGHPDQVLRTRNEIVLTESLAVKYFGSADNAMDKILMVDQTPMTVTGIAANIPVNSHIQFDLVVPVEWLRQYGLENWKQDINDGWVGGWPHTYVEISDPSKKAEAQAAINDMVARFAKKEWENNRFSYQYFMQPVRDIHLQSSLRYDSGNNGSQTTVRVFVAVAIFILLLACINYINLTTATALTRAKEISLRKVAGASRQQLMRQFFIETLMVTTISVAMGILLLSAMLPVFSSWMGQLYRLEITATNIAAVVGFILLIAVISGFYPSVVLSSFQPVATLKGRFAHSNLGQVLRKSLVVLQFTISTVLLVSILAVHQQMEFIREKPLGYKSDAVVAVNFNGEQGVNKQYQTIRNELLSVPYIESVALHSDNVVGGLGNGWIDTENNEGKRVTTSIYRMGADADYFDTYGMELVAGRVFERATADTTKSVLINEAAVKMLGWPSAQDALGKPFGSGDNVKKVIGVVKDFHFESLHKNVEPLLISHVNGGWAFSLRIERAHIRDGLDQLKAVWSKLSPDVPLDFSFIDESLQAQYGREQKMESVFYIFAGLSFLIACMGLFGLSTFMMQQRVREIGIRKVLGAPVTRIVVLLTTDFSKLVLISALIALPIGWFAMQQWLQTFAYHTTLTWWIFVLAAVIPVGIALLTVSMQSIRTALINPARTLRTE
ncbi:FtsX-like permease family protein [Chryseolinea sp. T2]|uniref:FtsX-like permease family protein n=1 Tax=Chryseolinea sp. T2 TaxID=3129255 RepID=UPI00307800F6